MPARWYWLMVLCTYPGEVIKAHELATDKNTRAQTSETSGLDFN